MILAEDAIRHPLLCEPGIARPYPWERKMTVCIAAACEVNKAPKVVLCTDWKIGSALGSSETRFKQHMVKYPNWHCLGAGVTSDINALIILLRKEFRDAANIDETNISSLLRDVARERKKEKASEIILSKFGMTYDEFMIHGKQRLPEERHRLATLEIEHARLGASVIVVGFAGSQTFICEINDAGRVAITENYCCIGEGAYLGESVLLQRDQHELRPLDYTIYCAYEAKKYAEKVPSVGTDTTITVVDVYGRWEAIDLATRSQLRDLYLQYGPKPVAPDLKLELGTLFAEERTPEPAPPALPAPTVPGA